MSVEQLKTRNGRTLDAVLDEVGVDVRRVRELDVSALEEGRGDALVEQPMVDQAEVLQAVPLSARLRVLQ